MAILLFWLWGFGCLLAARVFEFEDDVRLRLRVPLVLMWPISFPLMLFDMLKTEKPPAPDDAEG